MNWVVIIDMQSMARFSTGVEAPDPPSAITQAWALWRSHTAHPARVLSEHRGSCTVWVEPGKP